MSDISQDIIVRAAAVSTATLHEAMGKKGALPSGIKPVDPAMRLCGPALTVTSPPGDNMTLHRAIAESRPGQVLLATVSGHFEAGYWGEIMATAAQARGMAGLVIDGCVRDSAQLTAIGFATFSRGLCIRGTTKHGGGVINGTVSIGDIIIEPGDLVVGDADGVVIVPAGEAAEAVAAGEARDAREAETMEKLRKGATTMELYGWK